MPSGKVNALYHVASGALIGEHYSSNLDTNGRVYWYEAVACEPVEVLAVLVVGIGDVQIAVEELLLVLSLHMHDFHVLNGPVVGFADVHTGHGMKKAVVALQSPLQKCP